ncbi:MAG TPA: phage integrase SAM-like domain-containing protein [Candidatus Caccenecus avistercoris]|nr:phage integrase SAM-like domain-containing protein [Candidatus Caccenecus avistercoris]
MYFNDLYDREKRNAIDINTVYDHYKKTNLYIIPYFVEERGDIKLSQLTTKDIEDFYTYMRKRPNSNNSKESLSEKTIHNTSTTLNAILNFLVSDKKLKLIQPKKLEINQILKKRKKNYNILKKMKQFMLLNV